MKELHKALKRIRKQADKAALMIDIGPTSDKEWELCATAARTTAPHLVDALEKVLILHKPVEVEPSETICSGCSTLRGQGETARYFPFTEYPCPTVTTITTALDSIK